MVEASVEQRAAPVAEAWHQEAETLEAAGRLEEAEALLGRAIVAEAVSLSALFQAAMLSLKRKRAVEAACRLERAVALAPDEPLFRRNLCEIYRLQGSLDKALAHGLRSVELTPDDASAHYNLAVLYYDRMEIDEAIRHNRRAIGLDPHLISARFELAEALLVSGQFEEGWQHYEYRFELPHAPRLLPADVGTPLWDGKPMAEGTLLLIGDQGFGDTIQFCRYIPEAARLCPDIVVAASADMLPIISQQPGVRMSTDHWEELPAFHAHCPLSGLPRLFGANLSTIPAPIPYLSADPDRVSAWADRLDALIPRGYRRIAMCWAGRPTHGNDFNRTIPLRQLSVLAEREKIALISIQKGDAQAEIGRYFGAAPLFNLGAEIKDFADTMAILTLVDRLITVDTGVAHLAGAMGRPVSILLPFAPDWRWLRDRSDTPWYPSATLCRQAAPGDWDSAVSAMLRTLEPAYPKLPFCGRLSITPRSGPSERRLRVDQRNQLRD